MPDRKKSIYLIGYASGVAGAHAGSSEGPLLLQQSPYLLACQKKGLDLHWYAIIKPSLQAAKVQSVAEATELLAQSVAEQVEARQFFTVLGGDHSSAIGTWSGAHSIQSPLGLIWIDAHMDSHTPKTSLSGNIHGMPLACLLGFGDPALINIMSSGPQFKPENICLIGVRSYEEGEAALLKKLKVRIFLMEEIRERGIKTVMQEAIEIVTKNTKGFGVSLDIDSIDPLDAPATGVPEPDGIPAKELLSALKLLSKEKHFIGAEIVEFDPSRDKNQMTEKLIPQLLMAMTLGKTV